MTTPETQPAATRTPTKTYNLAQSVLSLDGVPFPAAGGDDSTLTFDYVEPAPRHTPTVQTDRTPDDVRNDPQVWDVLRFGEGCVLLVVEVTAERVVLTLWAPPMALAYRVIPRGEWPTKLYPTLEYVPGAPPERNGDLPLTEIFGYGCLRLTPATADGGAS